MKRILGIVLTLIFLAIFGVYFYSNQEDFTALTEIPVYSLLLIMLFKLLDIFSAGVFIKIMLQAFNKKIQLSESFYISSLSKIGNYFAPLQGGVGIRAVYLKRKFKLSYSHFLSTLSGNYVIAFLVNSLIAITSLIYIHIKEDKYSWVLYSFYFTLFVFTFLLSILPFPEKLREVKTKYSLLNRIIGIIRDIIVGWNSIIRNRSLLLKLILITFVNFGLVMGLVFVEFTTLGIDFNLATLALYSSLSGVTILVNLTPGAIGIREAIFLFSSSLLAITENQILQIAIIDRGTLFILLFILYIVGKLLNPLKVSFKS